MNGAKVVWADNWGVSVPEGQRPQNFVMQLDLPPDWERQFFSATPGINSLLLGD